jgi:hypothetical protein
MPLYDFNEPLRFIFSLLHFEISAVNKLLGSFRAVVEVVIEFLSIKEKSLCN